MTIKDYITLIIFCLALLVSAGTGYFSSIRQTDDVRIVTSQAPVVVVDDLGMLGVSGQEQIRFINLGNREVAVTGITLVLFRLRAPPPNNSKCNEAGDVEVLSLAYDFEPFIVDPGKIVINTFERARFPEIWKTDPTDSRVKNYVLGTSIFAKDDIVLTCLRVSVTTPDMVFDRVLVPKHYIMIENLPHEGPDASSVKYLSDSNTPYTVVRMVGTSLSH